MYIAMNGITIEKPMVLTARAIARLQMRRSSSWYERQTVPRGRFK
jgi:hypothetical protein